MGFYLNAPLTMSQLSSVLMGFFPDPQSNLLWYVVLGCVLFTVVVLGKNLYCAWVCPFGALQVLLNKISGISLPVPSWLKKSGKYFGAFLAWLSVFVIFATRNPALGSFEPFAALFSFNGFGLIWAILPVLIFGSFFIKRFWCRFFCPVGFILNKGCKIQNQLLRQISLSEKTIQFSHKHISETKLEDSQQSQRA